jgi:hypothetical protein
MVGSIGGIKQGFGTWRNVTLAVQKQVTNLLAQFGSTWLKGSHNLAASGAQKLF